MVLSSQKIDKNQYVTGEEILPSDQSNLKKQAKFTCSVLRKASGKQPKVIEDQGIKKVETLKVLKPHVHQFSIKEIILKDQLNEKVKNEVERTKKQKKRWLEKI